MGKSCRASTQTPRRRAARSMARISACRVCCTAKAVYAAHPHAMIKRIDTAEAERMEGVRAVITAKDIPGAKTIGEIIVDQYVLADDMTRFLGDVVAVVAADTKAQADEAAKRITVDYEELPILFSPAVAEGSAYVLNPEFPDNVCCDCYTHKGDAEAELEHCDVVVETAYETQFVEHAYIEPEVIVVIPNPMQPGLTIHGFHPKPVYGSALREPDAQSANRARAGAAKRDGRDVRRKARVRGTPSQSAPG